MIDPLRNQRDLPKFGVSYVDGRSCDLGTDAAPFDKYPGATGLHLIRNTGTTPWPPGTSIIIEGESYLVPNWLDKPVLSGEEVVVGVAELRESAPISELRAEPGNLKAARQPPPASSAPSPRPPARTGCGSWVRRRVGHWLVFLFGICSRTTSTAAVHPRDGPPGEPPPSPPPAPPDCSDSEASEREAAAGSQVSGSDPVRASPFASKEAERIIAESALLGNPDNFELMPGYHADREMVLRLAEICQEYSYDDYCEGEDGCDRALQFIDAGLLADPEFLLEMLMTYPAALAVAPPNLRGDPEFMLRAIAVHPRAYQFACGAARADKDVAVAAVRKFREVYAPEASLPRRFRLVPVALQWHPDVKRVFPKTYVREMTERRKRIGRRYRVWLYALTFVRRLHVAMEAAANEACERDLAENLAPGGPVGGETTGIHHMAWLAGRAWGVRDRKRPRQAVNADEATGEPAT